MDLGTALELVCRGACDQGHRAWDMVLSAIEAGKLPVDVNNNSLLCVAAEHGHPALMRRLLELGAPSSRCDTFGRVAMHWAALSDNGGLEKCKMLPVKDLGYCASGCVSGTPLHYVAKVLCCMPPWFPLQLERRLEVLQWMLDQPECPIYNRDDRGRTVADIFADGPVYARPLAMVRAAEAAQRRWTPLRAT